MNDTLEKQNADTFATGGTEMGKSDDLNRNWNREEPSTEAGNVSSISEGRRSEGWSAQVQQGASEIAGKVQDFASKYGTQAKEFANDAGKKVQDFASNAAEKTSGTIREYPLQSLLVGFGVGCLVGLLIPRR